MEDKRTKKNDDKKINWKNKIILIIIVAICVASYFLIPQVNAWMNEVFRIFGSGTEMRSRLANFLAKYGVYAATISFILMVLTSVIAPLPAFAITLTNAAVFGWWQGAILSWSSAMAGAALCFFIARILGRDVAVKFTGEEALKKMDYFFNRHGKKCILIARLLPFISFDVVSYAAGLTSMGFLEFFIATGIGQLPATIVYSYVGGNFSGGWKFLFIGLMCLFALSILVVMIRQIYVSSIKDNDSKKNNKSNKK